MTDGWFILKAVYALAVIAFILVALTWLVRTLGRGRILSSTAHRLTSVIESTYLTQQSTLHVIKVGERFYVVGGGQAGLTLICELPAEDVNEWIAGQRRLMDEQKQGLMSLWQRIAKPRS